MDIKIVFFFIILALIVVLLLTKPLKILKMVLANLVIGLTTLFLINLIGSDYGIQVSINEYSAGVSGILGIPGVVALVIVQNIIL